MEPDLSFSYIVGIATEFVMHFIGISAQLQNKTFCIGEKVVFNCTVDSVIHGWTVSGYTHGTTSITAQLRFKNFHFRSIGPFEFRLVDSNPLVSSVSVVASIEINSTIVMCEDGNQQSGSIDNTVQKAVIEILGKFTVAARFIKNHTTARAGGSLHESKYKVK